MNVATQSLYIARPRELDNWDDELSEDLEFKNVLQSSEIATVRQDLGFVSTGESWDDYLKRRKEGRVWRAI